MKFVYDIVLNFNEELYESYEWKDNDYVEYIKRIPLIKLNNNLYRKVRNNKIFVQNEFLDKIRNVTETYSDKTIKLIEYACLFTNGEEVIAVEFNNKGISITKSKLLLDEEEDTLDISSSLKELEMNIEVIGSDNNIKFNTRRELEKINFLNREIKVLYKDRNLNKLKYIYYECFNEMKDNIDDIYNNFIAFINSDWNNIHDKLYELLRLIYIKNS